MKNKKYCKQNSENNIMTKQMRPKIGLALGSGGPKGLSHIGVIKVLEENNIPIDFIAGSSIGAAVGGFYATNKNIKKIEEIALSNDWRQTLSLSFDLSLCQGFLSGKKIKKFIENIIDKKCFKDLKIPLSVVVTNIKTGEAIVINKGEVATAIRASISIPLFFKPVEKNDQLLVDGCLSMPVPVKVVKKMGADIIIAVNLDADYFSKNNINNYGFYKIANTSVKILTHHFSSLNAKEADIIINPKVGKVGWNKFINSKSVILAGEEAMRQSILQLKELIHLKKQ